METVLDSYVGKLVKSYNPNNYEKMLHGRMRALLGFLCTTIVIGLVLFVVFFAIAAIQYVSYLPSTIDQIEELSLGGTVQVSHPVVLMHHPSVVLDMAHNGTSSEHVVLLSQQGVVYPKYLFTFGDAFVSWDDLTNIKVENKIRNRIILWTILFLMPSIVFWFTIVSLVKITLLLALLAVLGFIVPKLFKHSLGFTDALKIAILALPSFVIFGVGLYPLAPVAMSWWGAILTLVIFTLGVAVVSKRNFRR